MKLLALDTSSACCSAALWIDGELRERHEFTARGHARLLLPMVRELLAEAQQQLSGLDAIAFGRGPGSFTGLRVAAGVVQGLAFGAGLGVLPVSDLRALAEQALRRGGRGDGTGYALACMDARMAEVYAAVFEVRDGEVAAERLAERVVAADVLLPELAMPVQWAAGRGLDAWPAIAAHLQPGPERCFGDAEPMACDVARLAARDIAGGCPLLPAEAAQPVYLRDRVASVAKNPPL